MRNGNRFALVTQISIEVKLREDMLDKRPGVVGWLSVEDDLLPDGVRLHLQLQDNDPSEIWYASYNIVKRCRQANMDPTTIRACIEDLIRVTDCAERL